MKTSSLLLAIVLLVYLATSCSGKDKALADWNFPKADGTLGWASAGGTIGFDKTAGVLTAKGEQSKLISPLFDIKATPLQYVEIEMKCNSGGSALMYYSNTTEEPYGGFRSDLYRVFDVIGDGQFHTYVIRPFWQNLGKVIHIRFDPPGTDTSIRAIRIVEPEAAPANTTAWEFKGAALGWDAKGAGDKIEPTAKGLKITGNRNTLLLSPALDLEADKYSWITLRMSTIYTPQTAELKWITRDSGLKSLPIQLQGDVTIHSYAINLSDLGDWTGNIVALGIVPTESSDARSMVLESIKLGDKPMGPAELQITKLELSEPYVRAGEKSKLVIEVRNTGGEVAKAVKLSVYTHRVVSGERVSAVLSDIAKGKTWLEEELGVLPPGATRRIAGDIVENEPGPLTVFAYARSATVPGGDVLSGGKSTILKFQPKLDLRVIKNLKYVPAPKPADTGEYLVGCYNFPGWRDYGAWSVLNNFPERKPLLGYYHDGNPEVNDWQITWALDHGIKFFIYDWYWEKGRRHLEEGLHDGFLKAKYQDRMKFCLLWANHNQPKTSSYDDCINVTKYWIENYFRRPNYLKLGGKNVMVIFSPNRLLDDMGADEVKRAFTDMNKLCEDSGVGGLYMVACVWPQPHWIKLCQDAGFDAFSGYNYPSAGDRGQLVAPYSWMVDGYQQIWEDIASKSTIPYIPLCEAGWDSRPWHGPQARQRTGKTPELWKLMLSNAKAYDDDPKHKLPEGEKLVFIEAWNEYGEGDYIEPHRQFGFDYLEAIRQVFAPESKPPVIVLPKDIGLGPYDLKKPVPVTAWNFRDPKARTWTCDGSAAPLSYPNGALHAQIVTNDPRLWSPPTEIDAARLRTLEVKMKADAADEAQLFFGATRSGFSERSSVKFAVKGDNQFHVYSVDLIANPLWKGVIGALRFDPCSKPGATVEIAYIKLR